MVRQSAVIVLAVLSLTTTMAQRPPYLGNSDPGVLPQYLPEGTDNRFGAPDQSAAPAAPAAPAPAPLHPGTLETEDVYNRVSEWPDQHKPFWYLNAVAIQQQREQEQQQRVQAAAAMQNRNRQSPFSSGSRQTSK